MTTNRKRQRVITAETISEHELLALRREGNFYARVALETRFVTERTRQDARRRCAEELNARRSA